MKAVAKSKRKANLRIALQLEGPESEKGLIRLDDLLKELATLEDALSSIDKEVNGKITLYYRVVDLSHSSPTRVVIEPVVKPRFKTQRLGNRYGHMPEQVHHCFFQTIGFIKNDELAKVSVGEPVIDAIANLLEGLGSEFTRGTIANSRTKFNLDTAFKERIESLIKPFYKSVGSVEGQLLAINLARGYKFYVYPEIGPRSVSCRFPEHLFRKAQAYIRKNVRVFGTKCFRQDTGFPYQIVDVTSIELLEPSQPFPEFVPSRIEVNGPNADELVRESREGWE